jgi:hypothetical protein
VPLGLSLSEGSQHCEQVQGDRFKLYHALASIALVQLTLKLNGQTSGREQGDAPRRAELSLKFTLPNWVVALSVAPRGHVVRRWFDLVHAPGSWLGVPTIKGRRQRLNLLGEQAPDDWVGLHCSEAYGQDGRDAMGAVARGSAAPRGCLAYADRRPYCWTRSDAVCGLSNS